MSYWYLASPYSQHPRGLSAACAEVQAAAAALLKAGIPVVSPIAHTHGIAHRPDGSERIDPLDHGFWMAADKPVADAAAGVIVLALDGWETSVGCRQEIRWFWESGRPVLLVCPWTWCWLLLDEGAAGPFRWRDGFLEQMAALGREGCDERG